MVGLLLFAVAVALPEFLTRVDQSTWDGIRNGEYLSWAAVAVAVISVLLLVARKTVLVSFTAVVAAALGVTAIAVDSKPWKLSTDASFSPWTLIGVFALLGLTALLGLRRVPKL